MRILFIICMDCLFYIEKTPPLPPFPLKRSHLNHRYGLALGEPAIVLWQQVFDTDGTPHRAWLAFKKLSTTLFSQNFDGGGTDLGDYGWTNEGTDLWRIEDNSLVIDDYDPGIAQSPLIHIPGDGQNSQSEVTLSFRSSIEFIYPFDVSPFARREVRIVDNGISETIPVNSRGIHSRRISSDR